MKKLFEPAFDKAQAIIGCAKGYLYHQLLK